MKGLRFFWLMVVLGAASALGKDRVSDARARRATDLAALLENAGLTAPPHEVYLRVFKQERVVELWAGPARQPLKLVKTYAICAASGALGPKRREGDLQVPEGFYEVPEFNSTSNFHLSMKVGYPNASDRARGDRVHPGGLIYLHGECASIGCIAIENEPVEEVYLLSLDAQVRRVDIFPTRLTAEALEALAGSPHLDFWRELAPAYAQFERTRRPAAYTIDRRGVYHVKNP